MTTTDDTRESTWTAPATSASATPWNTVTSGRRGAAIRAVRLADTLCASTTSGWNRRTAERESEEWNVDRAGHVSLFVLGAGSDVDNHRRIAADDLIVQLGGADFGHAQGLTRLA